MRRVRVPKPPRKRAPRPRVKPLWRRPPAIAAGTALAAAAILAGGWWVWQAGYIQRAAERAKWAVIAAAADSGFAVRDILVDGRRRTSPDALRRALRLERGAPILAFDAQAARRRLEALPWIRQASVERQLPDVVHLRLVERRPLAIWQHDGVFTLIDTGGVPIPLARFDAFRGLVVVVGADAPAEAPALFRVLAREPALADRVQAAVRIGGRRWSLHLKGGLTVHLPEDDPAGAWKRLARLDKQYGLLARALVTIDLRYSDRVILRPAKGGLSHGLPRPDRKPARPGTET